MAKVQTSLRVEENALIEAKVILAKLGMNYSEAVNVFTNMVVQHNGLPFSVRLPNAETENVIAEARKGKNVEGFTLDELK
jgi:DNA-damage-inducible protein J